MSPYHKKVPRYLHEHKFGGKTWIKSAKSWTFVAHIVGFDANVGFDGNRKF
jgi:hypothetical protein